jgi:transcriptional regulator with XRE-family HTH domain
MFMKESPQRPVRSLGVVAVSNERLRSTRRASGYSVPGLAEELAVDRKTVQRWITKGRTPHRSTALRAAKLLNVPGGWLWPDLDSAESGGGNGEVIGFYSHRSQVPKSLWLESLLGAKERIDFLTYAGLFLAEDNPESVRLIEHKAAGGVRVRMVFGDPDSSAVVLRAREERMPEGLVGRVRMALAYHGSLNGAPGVQFHLHRTTLYNSIYRFDDHMFVNQHIYGTYGYMAPILHLRRVEGCDLFDTYARSFDLTWNESYPAAGTSERGAVGPSA